MLMYHANALFNRIIRTSKMYRLIIYLNLPASGRNQAVEHIHQSCLACAILPQQYMNFPRL